MLEVNLYSAGYFTLLERPRKYPKVRGPNDSHANTCQRTQTTGQVQLAICDRFQSVNIVLTEVLIIAFFKSLKPDTWDLKGVQ